MINKSKFELEGAIAANKNSRVLEWTMSFLQREDRNKRLVEDIQKRKILNTELIDYPISGLGRVTGLQNGETNIEELPHWVRRVKEIEEAIAKNHLPPPIIVTDFWHELEIADGNHRHEALLKYGFTTYWTIFLFANHDYVNKVLEKASIR